MVTNSLGLIAALTVFLSIWLGHAAVRKIEAQIQHLWKPMAIFLILGHSLTVGALRIADRRLAVVCSIIGVCLLWDVLELKRQARRVLRGHAPANPNNPRHVALLSPTGARASQGEKLDPVATRDGPHAKGFDLSGREQES